MYRSFSQRNRPRKEEREREREYEARAFPLALLFSNALSLSFISRTKRTNARIREEFSRRIQRGNGFSAEEEK